MPTLEPVLLCTDESALGSRPSIACLQEYRKVREITEEICRPLANEDYVVQSMDDVHPPKWHFAHATWADVRLPTESAWEVEAQFAPINGNVQENNWLQPSPGHSPTQYPSQMFGNVWEWIGSAYRPDPDFKALSGSSIEGPLAGIFPGSSIGNFASTEAGNFLSGLHSTLTEGQITHHRSFHWEMKR